MNFCGFIRCGISLTLHRKRDMMRRYTMDERKEKTVTVLLYIVGGILACIFGATVVWLSTLL